MLAGLPRSSKSLPIAISAFVVALASACGARPVFVEARSGTTAALASAIKPEHEAGRLSRSDVTCMAHVVLERLVVNAKGAGGLRIIAAVEPCASAIDSALERRAESRDDVGARAALALVRTDEMSKSDARAHARDTADGWRAVGVRALVREEDRAARLAALGDPSPDVRRAAIDACVDAGDTAASETLADMARRDPELIVRSHAVRALAHIGGPHAEIRIRDLWRTADDALKNDLARALASPGLAGRGGREALLETVARGEGYDAVSAAIALYGAPGVSAGDRAWAKSVLMRSIEEGTTRERLRAIANVSTEGADVVEALRGLAKDPDHRVRIAAWSRLAVVPGNERDVKKALLPYAAHPLGRLSEEARYALATMGDRSIQAWIEKDLSDPSAQTRRSATSALIVLDAPERAAPVLADPDPLVRADLACRLILASRRR